MAKLNWDANGERIYSVGVDRGVFYPSVGPGIAWNGLIAVKEIPTAPDSDKQYYDGKPYRSPRGVGEFVAQLEAYTYPDEFEEYDGWVGFTEDPLRKSFDFSFRTLLGDDISETEKGYRIHLVYNASALPANKTYETLEDPAETTTFEWEMSTRPVYIPGFAPASHLIVDSLTVHPWTLEALEDILYGSESADPRMPSVLEVVELFDVNSLVRIVDNGDGTWTVTAPDEYISMIDATTFEITSPNIEYLDENTYRITSY